MFHASLSLIDHQRGGHFNSRYESIFDSMFVLYFCLNSLIHSNEEKMKRYLVFLIVLSFILIAGCKGEDGEDGKVYVEGEWTSDIEAIEFASIIKGGITPSVLYENTKYELEPGSSGNIYWRSNGSWYYYFIVPDAESGSSGNSDFLFVPKDGDDGKDTIMKVRFSGSMIYDLGTIQESQFIQNKEHKGIPSELVNIDMAIKGIKAID